MGWQRGLEQILNMATNNHSSHETAGSGARRRGLSRKFHTSASAQRVPAVRWTGGGELASSVALCVVLGEPLDEVEGRAARGLGCVGADRGARSCSELAALSQFSLINGLHYCHVGFYSQLKRSPSERLWRRGCRRPDPFTRSKTDRDVLRRLGATVRHTGSDRVKGVTPHVVEK